MVKNYFKMLKREFSGYNASKLVKDLMAGLTVAAVALPLALAFGESSKASAAAGLVTAIIGGIVISALSGASFQISGPTGAMSAVLATIVMNVGLNGIFIVCLISGIILLLCAVFRLGKLISLIPKPVITGFTSGIAVIIALGQVKNFFGTSPAEGTALEELISYFSVGFIPHLPTVLLGAVVVAVMIVWPKKWNAVVPSSLVGIIVSTVIYAIFRFDGVNVIGSIPKSIFLEERLSFEGVDVNMILNLMPSALTVAALGMIESLLCGASASGMKKEPFDANIELIGQAAGNIIIPFFGGVPATAAIARTSVAIKSGSQTRLTGIFHALWLLAAMFLLGDIMGMIPRSALAGVLIVTAWRMNEWHAIKYIFGRKFIGAILQFLVTMLVTVVADLTVAIIAGIVFSILLFVKNAARLDITSAKVTAERLAPRGELGKGHEDGVVVYITGELFFANGGKLIKKLEEFSEKEIVLSLRGVPDVDISTLEMLCEWCREVRASERRVLFCGMNGKVDAMLKKSGMYEEFGEECFYPSIDRALLTAVTE